MRSQRYDDGCQGIDPGLFDFAALTVRSSPKAVDRFKREISLQDRFTWAMAPFDCDDEVQMYFLYIFARNFAERRRVPLGITIYEQKRDIDSDAQLARLPRLESLYGAIDGYIWLAYRFGKKAFPEMELAMQSRIECAREIEKMLQLGFQPRSKRFAKKKKKESLDEDLSEARQTAIKLRGWGWVCK